MNKSTADDQKDFWEGETCEYCDGTILEKLVTLHRKVNDHYILIEDVPAGVCEKCGTRYFSANVLKAIEDRIYGHRKADREEMVSIYTLGMSTAGIGAPSVVSL